MRRSIPYTSALFMLLLAAANLNSCDDYPEDTSCTITDSDERPSKSTVNKQEAIIGKWAPVISATDMTELYPHTYQEFLPDSVIVSYSYAHYDTGTYWFNETILYISNSGTMPFHFHFLDYNRLQLDKVHPSTNPTKYYKRIECSNQE